MSAFVKYMRLCEIYQQLCKERGVTSKEIAAQTGLPMYFLKKLEGPGRISLHNKNMDLLCHYFGVDIFQLLNEKSEVDRNISENLKRLRKEKGVSIQEVSNATDVPYGIIEDVESGDFFPCSLRVSDLSALSAYFGVEFHIWMKEG